MKKLLILVLSLVIFGLGINETKLNTKEQFSYEYYYQDGVYEEQKLLDKHSLLNLRLIIEDGKISYVDFDRTIMSDLFKINSQNEVYYFVEGLEDKIPSSYRFLVDLDDFSTLNLDFDSKLISTLDLVVGLDNEKISDLSDYDTYLFRTIVDPLYKEDVDKLANFIEEKNSINGLSLNDDYEILNFKTNYNLEEEITLVKELLNSLKRDLSSKEIDYSLTSSNTLGIYEPGRHTKVFPNFSSDKMSLNVLKYYVNDNGKLIDLKIDEIINDKGIYTFRSLIDEEYLSEMKKISDQILVNQSIASFTLKTIDGKVLDLKEDKIKDYDTLYFNNIEYSANAKYLYLGINASLNSSVRELNLIDGVHYTSVDNMMMTLVVKDGKVSDMTIDETFKWDNAKVMIYDNESEEYKAYLLYIFEDAEKKPNVDPDDDDPFNEDGEPNFIVTKKVIYGDGTSFFYPSGAPVTFDKTYIDEKATLITTYGNLTKQNSLIYDNINNVNYHDDIETLINYFLETKNPYSLNILENGKTDTLDIDIEVANYQNLFSSAILEATSSDNIFNNPRTTSEDDKFKIDVADGRYYGIGSFASTDEGFYTLTVTVKDNEVTSVIFDETYDNYGVLTTKNNLKYDYYFDQELEDGYRDNYKSYYEVSKALSDYVYQNHIIEKLFNEALDSYSFLKDAKPFSLDSFIVGNNQDERMYANNFKNAMQNIINQMLTRVHTDRINEVDKILTEFSEDKYLISSERLGKAYIDLADILTITDKKAHVTDKNGEVEEVEVPKLELKVRTNDSTLRASLEDDGKLYFKFDDDLETAAKASLEVTYIYDDFDEVTKTYEFKIVPEKVYLNYILNHEDLHFNSDKTKLESETNLNIYDGVLYTNLVDLFNNHTASYLTKDTSEVMTETDSLINLFNLVIGEASLTKETVSDKDYYYFDYNFSKEDDELEVYFDLDESNLRTKDEPKKTYEFNFYDLARVKKEALNYKPGMLDNRLVNGKYDLSLGLDRLPKVNGITYSFSLSDGLDFSTLEDNILSLNNAADNNRVLGIKLLANGEVIENYTYTVLAKTKEEIRDEKLDLNSKEQYIIVKEDRDGLITLPTILNLDNSEDFTWYYNGNKIEDGYLDLSNLHLEARSITPVVLEYVYQDDEYQSSEFVTYNIVNELNISLN